jgi:hypothetical protein
MRAGILLLSSVALALAAFIARAASPDDPGAPVAASRYEPVISGTKRYRPVDPLPWGDINQRVTPAPKKTAPPDGKGAAPAPQHEH